MSMKNSNETIGNRTRDLPGCTAVPQPTAPPRSSLNSGVGRNVTVLDVKNGQFISIFIKASFKSVHQHTFNCINQQEAANFSSLFFVV
jgi:hypothetical protein